MKKKTKILIVIALLAVSIALVLLLALHLSNRNKADETDVAGAFRENLSYSIDEPPRRENGKFIANVDVTMPDFGAVYRESLNSFQDLDDVCENELQIELVSNMPNHLINVQKELEVVRENREWRIRDIDSLIEEQVDNFIIDMILQEVDFTSIIDVITVPPMN